MQDGHSPIRRAAGPIPGGPTIISRQGTGKLEIQLSGLAGDVRDTWRIQELPAGSSWTLWKKRPTGGFGPQLENLQQPRLPGGFDLRPLVV